MTETEIKTVGNGNLIPFQKGVSGNPNGRPLKEFSLTDGMRAFLVEKDIDKKQQRKDILIEKTYQMAQKGDISAIKLLWNYLEGMPQGSGVSLAIQNNVNIISPEAREEYSQIERLKEIMINRHGSLIKAIEEEK